MHWLKFNAVGAMGAVVQFALLTLFVHLVGIHYLLATALSVEAAILHNFVWHRRWTWYDRRKDFGPAITALARFNLTNGSVSISANLLSAYLLSGVCRIDPVIASIASTAAGALANFVLSDHVVFAKVQAPKISASATLKPGNSSGLSGEWESSRTSMWPPGL